jgi:hypothetical protein
VSTNASASADRSRVRMVRFSVFMVSILDTGLVQAGTR